MTPQNPDQPGPPEDPQDDRPQYGIRLTPEQQAEHQARLNQAQQSREAQQGQPGQSPYGQAPEGQSPYGQPGQQPYGYPTAGSQQPYGYPAPGPQQPLGPITRPKSIDRSYWLIIAAGAAFLIIELFSLLTPNMGLTPEMLDLYQEQFDAAGVPVEMESILGSVRVVAIVFTAILAGLYWLIATGIRRGSNVARIFGTILAVLSLTAVNGVGIVYIALGVAGIVFAYLRPSSEYLRAKAWEKAMRR